MIKWINRIKDKNEIENRYIKQAEAELGQTQV